VAPSLLHVRAFRSATGPSVHATAQPEPPRLPGAAAVRARPQPRSPKPSRCPPLGSATRAHAIARSTRTIARCGSRGSRLPSPLATGCRVRGGIGEPERIPRLGANCVNVEDCGPQRWGPRRCRVVEHQPETSPRGDPLPLSRFIAPFAPSAAGAPTASAARGPRRSMNPAVGGRGRPLFIGLGGGPARCRGDGERRAVSRSWGPTGRRSSQATARSGSRLPQHREQSSTRGRRRSPTGRSAGIWRRSEGAYSSVSEALRRRILVGMTDANRLAELRAEARHARERLDLYRAKVYGPRATSLTRLRELERVSEAAQDRLQAAERERP
jgi:hypothetical protein